MAMQIWERKVVFVGGASAKESFLPPTLSEIAFIGQYLTSEHSLQWNADAFVKSSGRSNVGKSSLINALTMQGKVRCADSAIPAVYTYV